MLPESDSVAWGATLRSILAWGYELWGWHAWKCLCRGQGPSFPLPPPCPGRPPLDQNLSPPTLAAGLGPPARSQTLTSQCGDVVPRAGLGLEPVEHSSSSQPGSHGDFCSVVFYSEMIVTLFFFFFFISILVKAEDILY